MSHASATASGSFSPLLRGLARSVQLSSPRADDFHRRIAERMVGNYDLDAVLAFVLDQVVAASGADRAYVALFDEAGSVRYSVVAGHPPNSQRLFPHSTTVVDRVLADRATVLMQRPTDERADGSSWDDLELEAAVGVPLRMADQILGLIYLDCRIVPTAGKLADLPMLESLAAYATLAVMNVQIHEEMAGRLQKLQVVNEVSQAISATLQLDRLLSLILHHALHLSGGEHGYILLGDEAASLTCLASADRDGQPVEPATLSRTILRKSLDENAAVCILDTNADAVMPSASMVDLNLRSVMCVPLAANGLRVGVLYLSSRALTKTFTEQDKALLEAIASQAALTIGNAQLMKEQEHQILELERALNLVKEAQERAVTDGLTGLYNHVYFRDRLLNAVQEAERYGHPLSVVLVDLDHFKRINDTYGHQTGDEVLRQVSARLRQMVRDCDLAARYGGEELALLLPQTDLDGAALVAERIREGIAGLDIHTANGLDVPVTASLGVASLRAGLTAVELVERADKALYAAKHGGRNQVGTDGQALHANSTALKEVREATQEAFLATVWALCEAVKAKDRYTAGHSHHVEGWVRQLGKQLGMQGRELHDLELAAVLHDVGKIGIPDAILQKPAALDDQEWQVMRTHPVQGDRILRAGQLPTLAAAVRHHHERWDGQGYPDGLRGDEIPLASRIVAVIDAWGAMTTDRVYRKAIGKERAEQQLREGAGTQFDPAVVEAFLGMVGEIEDPA